MAGKSLNKVQLIGNLGKDPELKYTTSGLAVATFSIATNERFKPSNSDEWQDQTEWHRIVAWGRQAEIAGEYLSKGGQVYIEGRLQTRSWDDKDGNKHYTTEIVVRDMILLGGRGSSGSSGGYPPHPADSYQEAPTHTGGMSAPSQPQQSAPAATPDAGQQPEEDIPF